MHRILITFLTVLILGLAACAAVEPDPGTTGTSGGTNTQATNTNTTPTDNITPGAIDLGTPTLSFTLTTNRDTSLSTNDFIDTYNGYAQDESGPEYLYRFSTTGWTALSGSVSGMAAGVDIDLHLLAASDDGTLSNNGGTGMRVVTRHDSRIDVLLPAGTWYLVCDSYLNRSGTFDLSLSLNDTSASVHTLPVPTISHDGRSTAGPLNVLDSYYNYSQDESGPEQVYTFSVESNCTITAGLYDIQSGADIDIHLLAAGPFGSLVCNGGVAPEPIARHDIVLRADLTPGSYFLVADSFENKSGSYSLRTGFRPEGVNIWDSFTDLGRTLTDAEVPTAIWRVGRAIDYISAHRPNDYLSIIGPPGHWDSVDVAMSGCGLTAAGIWRALGIDEPEIRDAYDIGMAVANIMTIGNRHGCRVTAQSLTNYPQKGDTVDIANPSIPGSDHVFMLTSDPVVNGSLLTFRAINGGQVTTDGKQLIKEFAMTATWTGIAWDINGRQIVWWVETEKIPRTINARLPADAVSFF